MLSFSGSLKVFVAVEPCDMPRFFRDRIQNVIERIVGEGQTGPVQSRLAVAFLVALLLTSCSPPKEIEPSQRAQETSEPATHSEVHRVDFTVIVSSLIDPAKLDTLKGDRAANSRLRKICCWLITARIQGDDPGELIDSAQAQAGYGGTKRAAEDKKALLRNLTILERLGCIGGDNMEKMRRGNAPTITRGPYSGDIASVDHIIPRSIAPELDEKLFNLEFMPSRMNRKKSDGVGDRQHALAREWLAKGLLSQEAAAVILSR
jgi:hypothetical protein